MKNNKYELFVKIGEFKTREQAVDYADQNYSIDISTIIQEIKNEND